MNDTEIDIFLRVPTEFEADLKQLWKDIRQVSDFTVIDDLPDAEQLQRFDAVALSEWVVPLSAASKVILPAVFGFLVARRGEVTIGDHKFKNLSAKQIDEILEVLKKHDVTK